MKKEELLEMEVNNYLISQLTIAIEPTNHLNYHVRIFDIRGIFYSKQPMEQLLEDSCHRFCSTVDGRISAVCNIFPYQDKPPLLIEPTELLIAFPTKPPTSDDCKWIFPHYIDYFTTDDNGHTYIVFKNEMMMELNCSIETFKAQKERAINCLKYFSPRRIDLLLWKRRKSDRHRRRN